MTEVGVAHDVGLLGFAVLAGGRGGEAGEEPHEGKGKAGAEAGGGLGDEDAAGGLEDAEDLADDAFFIGNDEEEARDDDGVDRLRRVREGMGVGVLKGAVGELTGGGAGFSTADEGFGEVDAGGAEIGKLF